MIEKLMLRDDSLNRRVFVQWLARAGTIVGCAFPAVFGQDKFAESTSDKNSRQVTVMAIMAIKGAGPVDPKLTTVTKQLGQIMPEHRFELIDSKTKRLDTKQSMALKAGESSTLTVELKTASNEEGKVEMLIRLTVDGSEPFESVVKTPANQLFFVDRKINNTDRLLIAVGAR
ncbi:MAG: hypothetical protein DWI24_10070 [Planctomycetota bacterium]|nr:MAG: hypothetical protein DWI24_10070 [Planctomycetota bacterium]